MKEKGIFDYIDELILIVKKLGQLCDQKDERIKELSRDLNNINYWLQAAIKKTSRKPQATSHKRHEKDTIE